MSMQLKKITARLQLIFHNLTPATFFVCLAAVTGLLFILITPPFQTPDEPVHFYRAYQISQLNMQPDKNPDASIGGVLPSSLRETVTLTATNPSPKFEPAVKYGLFKSRLALKINENTSRTSYYEFSATALYSPIAYIPQAGGIALARLMRLPPIGMMYMARVANLAVWIALIYLAIKFIPHKKWAVAVVGLIPMAVSQAGSQSTDVMATGVIILLATYIYKLREQKTLITNLQLGLVAVLGVVALLSKQVMIVFLPLVLLLPLSKLGKKKKAIIKLIAAMLIPVVALGAWTLMTKSVDSTSTFTNNQDPAAQIKFVLHSPQSFVNVLWNTHFFTWGDSITKSFIGTFGWMDAPISDILAVVGYITLFLVFIVKPGYDNNLKPWFTKKEKLALAGLAAAYWGIVNAALYAVYSPVGFKIIVGLQGRYFLPLLVLLIPLLYSKWLRTSEKAYKLLVTSLSFLLIISSLLTIFYRYYINNV